MTKKITVCNFCGVPVNPQSYPFTCPTCGARYRLLE